MHTEEIDKVPVGKVAEVEQAFRDAGATDVKAEPNGDGTWKVTATLPD